MTELLVRFSLLFILFFPPLCFSQSYPERGIDSLWKDVNHNLVLQDYESAVRTARLIKEKYPDFPLGSMLCATIEISKSYDLGTGYNSGLIDSLLNISFLLSEAMLEKNTMEVWANFFAGASLGLKAYFSAVQKDLVNAFVDGYSALQYFDKCLQADAFFYEAKIAIGTYLYWKSAKTSDLSWLPFFNDNRLAGIELLKSASDSASYNKFFARYSLFWIHLNEKNFEEAAKISNEFLKEYPGNRLFKYTAAKAVKDKNPEEALVYFEELVEDYRAMNNNHYKEIVYLHNSAQLYHRLMIYDKVIEYCDYILGIGRLSDYVESNLEERLVRVEKLRNDALRLSSKN